MWTLHPLSRRRPNEADARPLEPDILVRPLLDQPPEVALGDAGAGDGAVAVRLLPVVEAAVGSHRRRAHHAVSGRPDLQLQVGLLMPEGVELPVVEEAGSRMVADKAT